MIFGWNKKVGSRLVEMQAETISLSKLKDLVYDTYEPFFIWGRTEGATKPSRTFKRLQAYSIQGPRNQAPWNLMGTNEYIKDGYVILYDMGAGGFRTFPFNKIEKIEKDGQLYKIK